ATVVSVGTATIAAAIGAGGLGVYIFRGVAVVDDTLILAGALPAALMALAADGLLGVAERRFAWRGKWEADGRTAGRSDRGSLPPDCSQGAAITVGSSGVPRVCRSPTVWARSGANRHGGARASR